MAASAGLHGDALDRDGTVRAYVVTIAPEVAGRIVKLPVLDNHFVHKGDVLFEIEPADYRIALEQAQVIMIPVANSRIF